MMLIILVCLVVTIVGLVCVRFVDDDSGWWFASVFVFALGVVALAVCAITIPGQRISIAGFEQNIEAVRSTKPDSALQDAAWRIKAATMNGKLAEWKYYNTIFDWWIPDSIDDVKPL